MISLFVTLKMHNPSLAHEWLRGYTCFNETMHSRLQPRRYKVVSCKSIYTSRQINRPEDFYRRDKLRLHKEESLRGVALVNERIARYAEKSILMIKIRSRWLNLICDLRKKQQIMSNIILHIINYKLQFK